MKAMANGLIIACLLISGSAQLIYPDQYEQMLTSTTPPYLYTNINRQSKTSPSSFRSVAQSATLPMNITDQRVNVQYAPSAPSVAPSQVFQQIPSTTIQVASTDNPLQDWGNHVNDIIVRGIMKFALDVEREIYNTRSAASLGRENIIFSPLSLSIALALVLIGSAGRTFDEVAHVLGLETGVDISRHSEVVHQMFGLLLNQVHNEIIESPGPRVDIASAVYVQDGFLIRPEFRAISEKIYNSEVINVDFFGKGREAQTKINNWVRQKTMGKILGILNDVPPPQTNVILVSALYFNGEWNQHFLPTATKRKPFFIEDNEAVDVDLMYNGGVFPFYEDRQLGVKILGLPYKGMEMTMYVLLPDAKGAAALRNFQSRLTVDIVENLISNTRNRTCIIGMPRMKLSSTLGLRSTLQRLGLTSLFDPTSADLSLLSQGYNQQVTSPTGPSSPFSYQTPTVSPLPLPYTRPGKSSGPEPPPVRETNANDLFIFPRFGVDDQTNGVRRNYFTYQDKTRGLTVQQWSTGFSIGKSRKTRRSANNAAEGSSGDNDDDRNKNSYVVNESSSSQDNTKVVNLQENKYRFEEKEQSMRRRKRQNRPIDQNFLNFISTQNFPSYGLDNLRNSANLVNPGLFASDVLHKVEIDITEKGTEAAAVTAVIVERDGNQKRIIANRPFLFLIRHNPSKLVLFWGTVNTPTPNYLVT